MSQSTPKPYFGTDGIRGRVGSALMHPEFILKLGWAVGHILKKDPHSFVLIGKDTRLSGYMFESALEAGLTAAGMGVWLTGPMPTPAIAYLTRTLRAQLGIVISASHNPYHDNGIKFFLHNGMKCDDATQQLITQAIDHPLTPIACESMGKVKRIQDAPGRYIEFCKNTIASDTRYSHFRIVIDCAHGATYHIAPTVFRELGATVHVVNNQPNGTNINQSCGSTHPHLLQQEVRAHQADLGIALDGDGDRVLLVDHTGQVLDGDDLLFILAKHHILPNHIPTGIVGTLMSNLGLEMALQAMNLPFERTAVGDRHIAKTLQQRQWILGGEPSGHIICFDKNTSGDGIIAALQILAIMHKTGHALHTLRQGFHKLPQVILNVPTTSRPSTDTPLLQQPIIKKTQTELEHTLGPHGRIVLRASGTEPLIRIMVEGEHTDKIHHAAHTLQALIHQLNV